MDQTLVFFSMESKTMLELAGSKTIHMWSSTSDTKQATVAVTVTASGHQLPLTVILKGEPGGHIEREEIPQYPAGPLYVMQKKAWMDKAVMLQWVNKVLSPYVMTQPNHVIPLLLLDSYWCHMMGLVVEKINDLGVEVHHIPGGCTGLCQPIDVGYNRPFKCRLRHRWELWMLLEGLVNGSVQFPTQTKVATWIVMAQHEMTMKIIKNSWLHLPYNWFELDDK